MAHQFKPASEEEQARRVPTPVRKPSAPKPSAPKPAPKE